MANVVQAQDREAVHWLDDERVDFAGTARRPASVHTRSALVRFLVAFERRAALLALVVSAQRFASPFALSVAFLVASPCRAALLALQIAPLIRAEGISALVPLHGCAAFFGLRKLLLVRA